MTRSAANWQELPGSFDTTNSYLGLYEQACPEKENNKFGIPLLKPTFDVNTTGLLLPPEFLVPYRSNEACLRDPKLALLTGLHFYLDDYRFEAVWSRPRKSLSGLYKYGLVLTPDFSLYRDWPLAAQIWNIYRSRWLGAFWQAQGIKVVPTISWSTPASFEFCFLGVEPGGWVSVSNLGVRDRASRLLFTIGFEVMLERLLPAKILWYGDRVEDKYYNLANAIAGSEILKYPTRWKTIRDNQRHQKPEQLQPEQEEEAVTR